MKETIKRLKETREKSEVLRIKHELENKIIEIGKASEELDRKRAKLTEDELNRSYLIEFNSQSYASFYNTKIEKDKSILTLSVAGLGFLVTLGNISLTPNAFECILFAISSLCFLFCIYFILKIFDENAEYIIALTVDDNNHIEEENKLKKLDKYVKNLFYVAIFSSFILGLLTTFQQQFGSKNMNTESKNIIQNNVGIESYASASEIKNNISKNANAPTQETKTTLQQLTQSQSTGDVKK